MGSEKTVFVVKDKNGPITASTKTVEDVLARLDTDLLDKYQKAIKVEVSYYLGYLRFYGVGGAVNDVRLPSR